MKFITLMVTSILKLLMKACLKEPSQERGLSYLLDLILHDPRNMQLCGVETAKVPGSTLTWQRLYYFKPLSVGCIL